MGFSYEQLTKDYVNSKKIGDEIGTKGLREFIMTKIGRKIGPGKAATFLDGCEDCESLGYLVPRKWKRVL